MLESSTYNLNNDFIDPSILFLDKDLEDDGLYYFNARYYDSTTGRFINVDPIQDGTNWYIYCNNNPLNMIDPTGLFWQGVAIGAVVGAVSQYAIGVAVDLKSEGAKAFIPSKNEWKSIGASAVGGAVTGAASGGLSAVKNVGTAIKTIRAAKVAASATSGAFGAAAGKVTDNFLKGNELGEGVVEHAAIGAVAGGLVGARAPLKGGNLLGTPKDIANNSLSKETSLTTIGKELIVSGVETSFKNDMENSKTGNTMKEAK